MHFLASLSHLQAGLRPKQLQQVMGQTNQLPLGRDFLPAAKREAPESPDVLDLAKHGLDNGFAHLINPSPLGRLQLLPHLFGEARGGSRRATSITLLSIY